MNTRTRIALALLAFLILACTGQQWQGLGELTRQQMDRDAQARARSNCPTGCLCNGVCIYCDEACR